MERLSNGQPDISLLTQIHYMNQPEIQDFFANRLTPLLRSATRVNSGQQEISRGVIRGRVNWNKTFQKRVTRSLDEATYIIQRPLASYNTLENQLLRLFLRNTLSVIENVKAMVGTTAMLVELQAIALRVETALRVPWLREVDLPLKSNSLMFQRARRSRNSHYKRIADLQRSYDEVLKESKWESILKLLGSGWIAPLQDDDIFELFTLVKLLEVIKTDLNFGEPSSIGLIKKDRKHVAEFRRSDSVVARVFFDQSPQEMFRATSEYIQVVNSYTLRANPRRPDIGLEFILPNSTRRLLVECKKTDDDGYKRDSIYKGFGYLKDFGSLWESTSEICPKVIIVFPGKVEPLLPNIYASHDLALVCVEDRARLVQLLTNVISS